jgi:peptidoglycan/xylan/chitin deacetylase (PgdA/CDA1 family)
MSSRLSILIYHRVLPAPDPLLPDLPDIRLFARQMTWLKRCFRVLPLRVAVHHLRHGTLPARAACITFDDGYADNADCALPVLRSLGLPACFFIATAYLDGGRMWNDDVIDYVRQAPAGTLDLSAIGCGPLPAFTMAQKATAIDSILKQLKYLPYAQRLALSARLAPAGGSGLMLTSGRLLDLHRAGMEIGAHTETHPILSRIGDDEALAEIAGSKRTLERLTGAPVTLFAYPNGKPDQDYGPRHARMAARLGFEAAVTTSAGVAGRSSDRFQLPRYTPWEPDRARFLFRLMQNHWRRPA